MRAEGGVGRGVRSEESRQDEGEHGGRRHAGRREGEEARTKPEARTRRALEEAPRGRGGGGHRLDAESRGDERLEAERGARGRRGAEALDPVRDPGGDRARGGAERLADLGVREAEPVVEDDRFAELLRQCRDVLADRRDRVLGAGLGGSARRVVRGAALLAPAEVARFGHGRAPEPAARALDAASRPCGRDEPDERLLRGVLGGRGVAEEHAGDSVARGPVALDDRGEGCLLAAIAERRVERGVRFIHSTCMADHEASARGLRPPAGHTSLSHLGRNSRLGLQLGADLHEDLPQVVLAVAAADAPEGVAPGVALDELAVARREELLPQVEVAGELGGLHFIGSRRERTI